MHPALSQGRTSALSPLCPSALSALPPPRSLTHETSSPVYPIHTTPRISDSPPPTTPLSCIPPSSSTRLHHQPPPSLPYSTPSFPPTQPPFTLVHTGAPDAQFTSLTTPVPPFFPVHPSSPGPALFYRLHPSVVTTHLSQPSPPNPSFDYRQLAHCEASSTSNIPRQSASHASVH